MKTKQTTSKIKTLSLLCAAVLSVSACASSDDTKIMAGNIEVSDPFENTNRAIFSFNEAVDDAVIHPIANAYNQGVPQPARTGIDNGLKHLRSPVIFANQTLQGDVVGASNTLLRAIINTFVGFGGLVDVAGNEGIEYEGEDFGQTLAVWGVGHGPYVVAPLLGSSSVRDYSGYMVDSFADPLRWYLFNINEDHIYYTKSGVEYLNTRANLVKVLEDLQESSIDYYAATRSAYYQRRDAQVKDLNRIGYASPEIPEFDDY